MKNHKESSIDSSRDDFSDLVEDTINSYGEAWEEVTVESLLKKN